MMMKMVPTIFAVNSLAAFLAGAYVYWVDKKKAQNAVWFVYNIIFCVWNFSIYKALDSKSGILTVYWFRTALAAMIFLVPVFLHFLSVYSDRQVFRKQVLGTTYIIFFLFFAASFIVPDDFVKNIAGGVYFEYIINPSLAFHVFVFVFLGFLTSGFYYLLCSAKLYLNFRRNQRKTLFLGMLFGMMAPANFFLAAYKITFFPFGLFCVIPSLLVVSYTILKHHVLEVDIAINKTIVFSYFTLFVLLVHMFIVHVLHTIVGIEYFTSSVISGGVVLLNMLFTAHYAGLLKLNKITENIVYEKKLAYYKFLENFNAMSDKIKDVTDLSNFVLDSLINIVGIQSATLYLYNENDKEFTLVAFRGIEKAKLIQIERISVTNPFINFLKEDNIYVASETEDFKEDFDLGAIKKAFEAVNLRLTIPLYYSMPLYHSRDMIGFLNLGNKADNSRYDKEDIDILNAFGRQLSICIDNAKLYYRSIEDDLTKLYRVDYFNRRIQEEINRYNRYQRPFSLLFIDVDDFKKINDTYGHQMGDEVLRKIGHLIITSLRKADIAARYGGEEFSILMPETDERNAAIGAERLRKAVEKEFSRPWPDPAGPHPEKLLGKKTEKPLNVTVSIGVSDFKSGMRKYELIKKADEALYKAKSKGKNQVAV